jgi:methylenetetrahydrofolate reductase (NADPH)
VRRVLVIGDRAEYGQYRRAIDVIDTGLLHQRGMRALCIAGYPDGHPFVSDEELNRALCAKIAAGEATGLAVEIVCQFCFDTRAILNYLTRLRTFGFEHPVRIGLSGPTSLAALMRYASRCGVRASAQALAKRAGLFRCVSAWNKDPVFGVIGIQSGPRG